MSDSTHIVCPNCSSINRVPVIRIDNQPQCGKCHDRLFGGKPLALDEAGFYRHLQRSELPLLVDFWAPWCGPCRMMAPAFEQAAAQLEPKVRLIKINTEENQRIAAQFGIRSIPTLIVFKGGRVVDQLIGAAPKDQIRRMVERHL